MRINIGDIVEHSIAVQATINNSEIDQLFKDNYRTHGIIIIENKKPLGMVTRTDFYQKLGSMYGYNLYINRPVSLLMKEEILCFDYQTSITEVSEKAMDRSSNALYDDIVVTKEGHLFGSVSIRSLLMTLASVQSQIASSLNPLTKLPGNRMINDHLKELLSHEKFAVLYVDLDQFKAYNDVYGFSAGDKVIQETASILQANAVKNHGFVGHVGGDDFVVLLYSWDFEIICEQIIANFDQSILSFYKEEHREQGYVKTENRKGEIEEIPLVSISIAVVTNRFRPFDSVDGIVNYAAKIKKECKTHRCSCFISNQFVTC